MKNLWLFDIDGTLVNINKLHLAAYRRTYLDNGIRLSDKAILSTFGMTEKEMLDSVFSKIGLKYDQYLAEKIKREHQRNIFESINELNSIKPLAGVREFLTILSKHNQYAGIVTGNLKETAELILKKSKLSHFFRIIGYDDNKKSRKQIVKDAVFKAKRKFDFEKVIVIGDTIHDIEAGKHINAFTVAVATGSDKLQKLKAMSPDLALPNLKNYRKIVDAVPNLSS